MFKFLRKYNTLILVIGGSLLMIVFLLGSTIPALMQQLGGNSAAAATLANGESISAREWQRVQQETEQLINLGVRIPFVGEIREPGHWYLLTREAEAAGFIGGPASAREPGFITSEQLNELATTLNVDPRPLYDLFAKVSGVRRLVRTYLDTAKLSDARIREFAAERLPSAMAQLVVIEAEADQATTMPSEAEMQEHFQAYRDIEPGEGEMGFGYRLPNRVRIEWIAVDPDLVRNTVRDSDRFSEIEQIRHWQQNAGVRRIPAVDERAEEIPQIVKDDLLNQLTEDVLDDIAKYIRRQVAERQRGLTLTDGYLDLPSDWASKRISFAELANRIQREYGIASPTVQSRGEEWLDRGEIAGLDGIGTASTQQFSAEPMTLPMLFDNTRAFGNASPGTAIQEGVTGPVLRDLNASDGAVYAFRFTEVDASRPADDLGEVRDAVIADLRRLAHYESLVARLDELERMAERDGLLAVALESDSIIQVPTRLARCDMNRVNQLSAMGEVPRVEPTPIPVIGPNEDAIDTIIEYSQSLPVGESVKLTEAQRVLSLPVRDALAVMIVRITQPTPVSEQDLDLLVQQRMPQMIMQAQDLRLGVGEAPQRASAAQQGPMFVIEAFTYDALARRHGFEERGRILDDEDVAATDESAAGM